MEGEVFVAILLLFSGCAEIRAYQSAAVNLNYFVCRQDIVQGKLVFMQTFADKSSIILV